MKVKEANARLLEMSDFEQSRVLFALLGVIEGRAEFTDTTEVEEMLGLAFGYSDKVAAGRAFEMFSGAPVAMGLQS